MIFIHFSQYLIRKRCENIILGNISKYIGEEEADLATNVTHKWLIYVSTKTSAPVDQIVSRARFFLHESYKPNDVIEVR